MFPVPLLQMRKFERLGSIYQILVLLYCFVLNCITNLTLHSESHFRVAHFGPTVEQCGSAVSQVNVYV